MPIENRARLRGAGVVVVPESRLDVVTERRYPAGIEGFFLERDVAAPRLSFAGFRNGSDVLQLPPVTAENIGEISPKVFSESFFFPNDLLTFVWN